MRFLTEYTCGLLNVARHAAFGKEAAKMVLTGLPREWPNVVSLKTHVFQNSVLELDALLTYILNKFV